jgi:chromosome segregation ATPase
VDAPSASTFFGLIKGVRMARELSRELFGSRNPREAETGPANGASPQLAKAEEVRVLHLHIENLNKRLKEFESRVETLHTKVDDMSKQNKQRFERVQGHFQNQSEMVKSGFGDFNAKIAQVVSRVNERKVNDSVIKEMVERHTQVVQGFEVRLGQLQRVISEQEMQLMNARSELKDALQELSRLKKL